MSEKETKEEAVLLETEENEPTQAAGTEEVALNSKESNKKKGETDVKKPSEKLKPVRIDGKEDFSSKNTVTHLSAGKPKKTRKVVLGTNKRTFTRTDY